MTYATTYNITGFGKPNTVVAICAKYFDEDCNLIFETEPYNTVITDKGEIETEITLVEIPNTENIKFFTQGTLNYYDVELFCGALPRFKVLFGAISNQYVANSFVLINGQIQSLAGEPVPDVSYEVNFPFAIVNPVQFTTDENGYFSIQFQTRSDLAFPNEDMLTFTNLQTSLVDEEIPISVSPSSNNTFTLSVSDTYYWLNSNNQILVSGNAPVGNTVVLSVDETGYFDTVIADVDNKYSFIVNIDDLFLGNQLIFTATSLGFNPQIKAVPVIRNVFSPEVTFSSFSYN